MYTRALLSLGRIQLSHLELRENCAEDYIILYKRTEDGRVVNSDRLLDT